MRRPFDESGDFVGRLMAEQHANEYGGEQLRQAMIRRQGPAVAAWLAFRFRAYLHQCGAFDLVLRPGEVLPTWCSYGIEFFRLRPKSWSVDEAKPALGGYRYRIRWLDWRSRGPHEQARERRAANARKRARAHLRVVR